MKKKKKFYTVWIGRMPGIYEDWEACKKQIHGYEGAIYKSFFTLESAQQAYQEDSAHFIGKDVFMTTLTEEKLEEIGLPLKNSICVDGAWNIQTNVIEYQGVDYLTKKIIFHVGPYKIGTNNIAEFLALVHALAYCKNNNLDSVIYSDSRTAISWVKRKKAATKIEISDKTKEMLSIIMRAEDWLKTNDYKNEILKWHTEAWGENPADFGRKK